MKLSETREYHEFENEIKTSIQTFGCADGIAITSFNYTALYYHEKCVAMYVVRNKRTMHIDLAHVVDDNLCACLSTFIKYARYI